MTYDHEKPLDLTDRVRSYAEDLPWANEAQVRLREQGHIVTGQVYVVPRADVPELAACVERATREIEELDWRLHEVDVIVVPRLDRAAQGSA